MSNNDENMQKIEAFIESITEEKESKECIILPTMKFTALFKELYPNKAACNHLVDNIIRLLIERGSKSKLFGSKYGILDRISITYWEYDHEEAIRFAKTSYCHVASYLEKHADLEQRLFLNEFKGSLRWDRLSYAEDTMNGILKVLAEKAMKTPDIHSFIDILNAFSVNGQTLRYNLLEYIENNEDDKNKNKDESIKITVKALNENNIQMPSQYKVTDRYILKLEHYLYMCLRYYGCEHDISSKNHLSSRQCLNLIDKNHVTDVKDLIPQVIKLLTFISKVPQKEKFMLYINVNIILFKFIQKIYDIAPREGIILAVNLSETLSKMFPADFLRKQSHHTHFRDTLISIFISYELQNTQNDRSSFGENIQLIQKKLPDLVDALINLITAEKEQQIISMTNIVWKVAKKNMFNSICLLEYIIFPKFFKHEMYDAALSIISQSGQIKYRIYKDNRFSLKHLLITEVAQKKNWEKLKDILCFSENYNMLEYYPELISRPELLDIVKKYFHKNYIDKNYISCQFCAEFPRIKDTDTVNEFTDNAIQYALKNPIFWKFTGEYGILATIIYNLYSNGHKDKALQLAVSSDKLVQIFWNNYSQKKDPHPNRIEDEQKNKYTQAYILENLVNMVQTFWNNYSQKKDPHPNRIEDEQETKDTQAYILKNLVNMAIASMDKDTISYIFKYDKYDKDNKQESETYAYIQNHIKNEVSKVSELENIWYELGIKKTKDEKPSLEGKINTATEVLKNNIDKTANDNTLINIPKNK